MNKLTYSLIISLSLLTGTGTLSQVEGQAQEESSNVTVYVLGSGKTHRIDLKAIEGQTPISNFIINPESVVQVKQGENLVTFSQPAGAIDNVKLTDSKGVVATLRGVGNSQYSLEGFPTGAYILDVIANLGSDQKGAYETFLVILAQNQQPVQPQKIIQTVQISDNIRIIFPPDPPGDNPPKECEEGFVLVGDDCLPYCPEPQPNQDSNGNDNGNNNDPCEPIDPIDPIDPDPPCTTPECAPTECPDGRIVPPGQSCPPDVLPCDDPNAPDWCSVPTECPDGTIIPPGEQCPDEGEGDQGPELGEDIPIVPEEPIVPDEPVEGDQDQDEGQDQDQGEGDGSNDDSSEQEPDQDTPPPFG